MTSSVIWDLTSATHTVSIFASSTAGDDILLKQLEDKIPTVVMIMMYVGQIWPLCWNSAWWWIYSNCRLLSNPLLDRAICEKSSNEASYTPSNTYRPHWPTREGRYGSRAGIMVHGHGMMEMRHEFWFLIDLSSFWCDRDAVSKSPPASSLAPKVKWCRWSWCLLDAPLESIVSWLACFPTAHSTLETSAPSHRVQCFWECMMPYQYPNGTLARIRSFLFWSSVGE